MKTKLGVLQLAHSYSNILQYLLNGNVVLPISHVALVCSDIGLNSRNMTNVIITLIKIE
jgi:hypothetical protein